MTSIPPPETDGVLRFPRDEIGASVGEECTCGEWCGQSVETVEYRVTGTSNMRRHVESAENRDCALAERIAQEWRDGGWTNVRVESRTVRTWTSGWRPVDTGGQQ